mmetsp:Transcript_42917/g.93462  ORF Transcript_42917/g.93462 Transcript_42917/m.93462 type:complete len:126 (-) Transcript_42917:209-586(-)
MLHRWHCTESSSHAFCVRHQSEVSPESMTFFEIVQESAEETKAAFWQMLRPGRSGTHRLRLNLDTIRMAICEDLLRTAGPTSLRFNFAEEVFSENLPELVVQQNPRGGPRSATKLHCRLQTSKEG